MLRLHLICLPLLVTTVVVVPTNVGGAGAICGSSSDSAPAPAPSGDGTSFGSGKVSQISTIPGTSPSETCKGPCENLENHKIFFECQQPLRATTIPMTTGVQGHHDPGNFHTKMREVSSKRTLAMENLQARSQWRTNHHIPHEPGA